MINPSVLHFLVLLLHRSFLTHAATWDLLLPNIGISAMHMQLLNSDRVVIFDLTNFGPSNISLPNGTPCRTNDLVLPNDCTAHSVEYDVSSNTVRPLMILTSTLCSSGAVMPDGTLAQTGGTDEGIRNVRVYTPCNGNSCDWQEFNNSLAQPRWYATNHVLPDGREIVVGGRGQFNFEFHPKIPGDDASYDLPFLAQTNDLNDENNLYPFVFLNPDGNLFIFANNRAILLNHTSRSVVKTYPTMPGGDPRNYPSSGSAVLLPLTNLESEANITTDVLVCGGAPRGAFASAGNGTYRPALDTCGRIRISDPDPQWVMQTMPMRRVLGDMVLLPDGTVLIINGAGSGTASAGEMAREPVLTPVVYRPDSSTFEVQNSSTIPRMYHSTAILLRDGRVLVGGSNPYIAYRFTNTNFPTDLSLESFSPTYLDSNFANLRPQVVNPNPQSRVGYGQEFRVRFTVPSGSINGTSSIKVTMVAPSFTTHSFSMNQRMLVLTIRGVDGVVGGSAFDVRVVAPGSGRVAPPGFYLLFVVHQDVPSEGIWIQLNGSVLG